MAAFNAQVRTNVLQVLVGMFNATPGARFLNEFAATIQAAPGTSDAAVLALAETLSNSSEFISQFPRFQTADEFSAKLLANLGLSGNAIAKDFAESRFNQGQSKASIIVTAVNALAGYTGTDAALLAAKNQLTNKVAVSTEYSVTSGLSSTNLSDLQGALAPVTADVATRDAAVAAIKTAAANNASAGVSLTTGADNIVGGFGADNIFARIIDNTNTLQSGDKINGSAGLDTLTADIGTSQNFAITPELTSVETLKVRAQAQDVSQNGNNNGTDNGQNNIGAATVQLDLERALAGKTSGSYLQRIESNNSRADLIIEDVRLGDNNDITRDVTIAFVDSDPGNVDYAVYFDQPSLRAQPGTTASTLQIQLRDGLANAATPLGELTVNGLGFQLAGKPFAVQSEAINAARTYQEFVTAFNARIVELTPTNPELATVRATVGQAFDNVNGAPNSNGNFIVIADSAGRAFGASNTTTALFSVNPPADRFTLLFNPLTTQATPTRDLITSTIVLDNVGRGSTGGDLVIGGLSAGQTSSSVGVERFDITVERNSTLQQVESTNNALREVLIKNGTTKGNLTVRGDAAAANVNNVSNGAGTQANGNFAGTQNGNQSLPGSTTHGDAYGFNEVRTIDASTMEGAVNFTAALSNDATRKYLNLTDGAPAQANADNPDAITNKNFEYRTGAGNDTIELDIGSGNFDRLGTTTREDFLLTVEGGAGNDRITVRVVDGLTVNGAALDANGVARGTVNNGGAGSQWYINSTLNANMNVNAGAGDDTVSLPGTGNFTVDLGAGNDVFYSDGQATDYVNARTGAVGATGGARWAFNTADQLAGATAARNVNNMIADGNDSYTFFGYRLNVSFKNLPGVETAIPFTITDYTTNDLQVNQAIKAAINNSTVLNKLIVAEDGPASTLVVRSLIDGVMDTDDLRLVFTPPTATSLSAGDLAAAIAAYRLPAGSTADNLLTFMANSFGNGPANATKNFIGEGDYFDQFQTGEGVFNAADNNNLRELVGANGTGVSDNVIIGNTGDDVIVLSTTADAGGLANDSNETVRFVGDNFGSDVIVNFSTLDTNEGGDVLDFSSYLGGAANVYGSNGGNVNHIGNGLDGQITIGAGTNTRAVITIDYADLGITTAGENFANLTAAKVLAAMNANNNARFAGTGFVTVNNAQVNQAESFVLLVADNQVGTTFDNRLKVFSGLTSTAVTAGVASVAIDSVVERGLIDLADLENLGATNLDDFQLAQLQARNFITTARAAQVAAVSEFDGLAGADTIVGTRLADIIRGNAGNDSISALEGNDTISGGDDNDSIDAGAGDDVINAGAGIDTVVGGTGNDTLTIDLTRTTTNGFVTGQFFTGGDQANLGLELADQVVISNFNRTVGTPGFTSTREVLVGFASANVGNGAGDGTEVRLVEQQVGAGTTFPLGNVNTASIDDEGVILTGATFHVIGTDATTGAFVPGQDRGANFSQVVLGTNQADTTANSDGNDYVNAGQGNDVVGGGAGNDFLVGGEGDDALTGGAGADLLLGNAGADTFGSANNFAAVGQGVAAVTPTIAGGATTGLDAGETLTFAVTANGVTTVSVDRVIDFNAAQGDKLDVATPATAPTNLLGVTNALANGTTYVAYGTFNAATGVFTAAAAFNAATAADALVVTGDGVLTAANSTGYVVLSGLATALVTADFI